MGISKTNYDFAHPEGNIQLLNGNVRVFLIAMKKSYRYS